MRRLGSLILMATLAAGAARADHEPCLTIQNTLADYAAAFAANGWQVPDSPERRQVALNTLAEAQAVAAAMPTISSDSELAAFAANARSGYAPLFDGTEVLVKGDAAASLRIEAAADGPALYCLIAGPRLDDVDAAFAATPPGGQGDVDYVGGPLPPPEGAIELRADMTRATFSVLGRSDFRGTDAVFVTLKLAPR